MKHLVITFLAFLFSFSSYSQNTYHFTRSDSIVVRFNSDTLKLAWTGGVNYGQFSNIDFNFDGNTDLFVFDRTGNKVLTFVHNGNPGSVSYSYEPQYERLFPDMQNWCILYDYNCDGLPDIFTHTPGGIKVYRNTSSMSAGLMFELETSLVKSDQLGNYVNLYVSSVDIPGLSDIDEDGDLDILTFGVFGSTVEYHRNYSVENGHGCDSLEFTLVNQCWGCFSEDASTNNVNLYDTCSNSGISNPQLGELIEEAIQLEASARNERHTGSCFCVIDVDGNKMKDLLLGDVSFSNTVLVVNGATSANSNMCMDSVDINFPSYDDPVSLKLFPCSFYVDVNNDGKRDLVTTPQSTGLSENARSIVYHYNSNHDTLPYFNFVSRDLLQSEMIEAGEGSYPVLADYNGDGLLDLFVANYGFFNSANDTYVSRLSLYQNTGTSALPEFNLVSSNFENLDLVIGLDNLYPAFGDLDNDGDLDMVLGNETGTMSYFENIAGSGNPADYNLIQAGLTDGSGTIIDIGVSAAPVLVDLDRDGDLDLAIGNKSGKIAYYQNMGSPSAYNFRHETDFLGQLNVKEWWDNSGYSVPSFYDDNGSFQLFIGSKNGHVHRYDSIDNNLQGAFRLVDSTFFETPTGIRSTVSVVDINGDTLPDMFMGNYRGGLTYFAGSAEPDPDAVAEIQEDLFRIFPNPADRYIQIVTESGISNARWELYDLTGRIISSGILEGTVSVISLESLSQGTYLIRIQKDSTFETHKIILCHE